MKNMVVLGLGLGVLMWGYKKYSATKALPSKPTWKPQAQSEAEKQFSDSLNNMAEI